MSNYLVINLADKTGIGAISSLKSGITAKQTRSGMAALFSQNNTEMVNAFAMLEADVAGTLARTDPEVLAIRAKCLQSKKIYFATHGIPTCTDNAYGGATGGAPLCSVDQMAKFLLLILPKRDKEYNLALVMCYGARSATFRSVLLNHQGMIPFSELKTSFAYKLYSQVARHRSVRMTARTGAVAYDAKTGASVVENEASIDARVDKEIFLRSPHIKPAMDAFKSERTAHGKTREMIEAFTATQKSFEANPTRVPRTAKEIAIKDYVEIMRTKKQYSDIMDANQDIAKYGKLVYAFDGFKISILSKYANNGRSLTLYKGVMA
jgi:hypothetical protein